MRLVFFLLAGLYLIAPRTVAAASADALTVHVNLEFDSSIKPATIIENAKAEAVEIWRKYHVALVADPDVRANVCIDAVVERRKVINYDGVLSVLGHTTMRDNTDGPVPVRITFDAIEALVPLQYADPPVLHDRAVATALGRVLAHEIGHVLLGAPAYHDRKGLMRATFRSDEFVPPERSRFMLTDRSIGRLRTRIASFADSQPARSCVPGVRDARAGGPR